MSEIKSYYAHGKLLLTGEYAVLDGALALAVPTKKGQRLTVRKTENSFLEWKSVDENGLVWFESVWDSDLKLVSCSNSEVASRLENLLRICGRIQSGFVENLTGLSVETQLEFNRNWGLGSSSTLIYLLSQWADVDPYTLLSKSFGGSGYDIACAHSDGPILYQIQGNGPWTQSVSFRPEWTKNLFFVYLGQKQISQSEIAKYSELDFDRQALVQKITDITQQILTVPDVTGFQKLLLKHEELMSEALGYPKVSDTLFSGIDGVFKSLGAWGGDFVLFAGAETSLHKIRNQGFVTIIAYDEMVIRLSK